MENNRKQKLKKKYNSSFNGIILLVLITVLPILTSYTPWIKVKPPILAVAMIVLIASIISIYCIMSSLYKDSVLAIQEECYEQLKENYPINIHNNKISSSEHKCLYHNFICCAEEVINSDYYNEVRTNLNIDEESSKRYNVMSDSQFDLIESRFFDNYANGEIWVVSYALETEILTDEEKQDSNDDSLLNSMETVKNNIQNKKGRYVQFVALGPYEEEVNQDFRNRKKEYWSYLKGLTDEEIPEKMPVIIIDSQNKTEGSDAEKENKRRYDNDLNYLVKLTSTVLLISNGPGEEFIEGYFTLRPDTNENTEAYERRTIMYKMPNCMRDEYYKFLKKKKEEYFMGLKTSKKEGE